MRYSLGTNCDKKLVECVVKINQDAEFRVDELFGALSFSVFGAAKCDAKEVAKSREEVEEHVKIAKQSGIQFNYLMNASVCCSFEDEENVALAKKYLRWIEGLEPDVVTIGNEQTIAFCQQHAPHLNINLSIVLGLRDLEEVNRLRSLYPSITRVTFHQALNRNRELLRANIANAKADHQDMRPLEVELLANEICLYDCPRFKEHYDCLSAGSLCGIRADDSEFHEWCNQRRVSNSLEFLNSSWIRPEDVRLYDELGVDILKLAGREESTEYLIKCASAYCNAYYNGNVMDLFYADYWPNCSPPVIDNARLDGFVEFLWAKGMSCLQEVPSEYPIEYTRGGNLPCDVPGEPVGDGIPG